MSLVLSPVNGSFGAEVSGVDLRAPIDEALAAPLRYALARHRVLFFRDQQLDDEAHLAVARVFGEPMVHPFERAMGRDDPLHRIVDRPEDVPDRSDWHSDDTYLERPPAVAILRCELAPEVGGDTLWADMAAAYQRLAAPLRELFDGLVGVHETDGSLRDYLRTHLPPDAGAEVLRAVGEGAEHPLVRVHPETGQRALFFELSFMRRIVGLADHEADFVRALLRALVSDVSLQCRFRWRAGDIVIWDERMTQHCGAADHAGQRRVMRRCTVRGERPVSVKII